MNISPCFSCHFSGLILKWIFVVFFSALEDNFYGKGNQECSESLCLAFCPVIEIISVK